MDGEKRGLRVIIIGAGASGLVLAHGLKNRGIPFTVYEQDEYHSKRTRDWNYGIYWAQSPLKYCLPQNIIDRISEAQVEKYEPFEDDFLPLVNGSTGEIIGRAPTPFAIRLQRKKFLQLLREDIDVEYGKTAKSVESDGVNATVFFQDGSKDSANLIVGAEGAHSLVRKHLFGLKEAAAEILPVVASGLLTTLPAELSLTFKAKVNKKYVMSSHPEGMLWMSLHDCADVTRPETWKWTLLVAWMTMDNELTRKLSRNPPEIVKDMKERAPSWTSPYREFIEAVPDENMAWHGRLSTWKTRPWNSHNGTLTIIGDAAHTMTFHRGQGLSNAIQDVTTILKAFEKHNVTGASSPGQLMVPLGEYQEEVCVRGKEAVESAIENCMMIHNWELMTKSQLFNGGLHQTIERSAEQQAMREKLKHDRNDGLDQNAPTLAEVVGLQDTN